MDPASRDRSIISDKPLSGWCQFVLTDDGDDDDVENFEEQEGEITREDLLENQEEGTAAKEAKVYAAMSSLVNYVQAVR